jgi:PAS domain S-box-containing protein
MQTTQANVDDTQSLRRCVQELAALSTLAGAWGRSAPREIADGLASVLCRALPVAFVYVRLISQGTRAAVELARTASGPAPADRIQEIGQQLEPLLSPGNPVQETPAIADPFGSGTLRLVISPLGCDGDRGVLVTAWPRPDLPCPTDRLLLDVAANQAAAALQHRQIEGALRRSQQELADFFDNAAVGLHWVGPDGMILRVNRAELQLLGYSAEEYIGHHIAEFHADQDVICDILRRLQTGQELRDCEARMRCKDGSIKHVAINSNVVWENGQFVHARCFTRDITDRKRIEEALRRQTDQFATLVEHIPDIVARLDSDLRFLYISPAVHAITGTPAYEYVGKLRTNEGIAPEFAEAREHLSRKALETGQEQTLEFPIQSPAGERLLECRFIPEFAPDGSVETLMTLTRDVTERKRAEEALRESERRFRVFADTAPAMLWVTEPDASCLFRSRGWYEFTGQTEETALRFGWLDAVHAEDRAASCETLLAANARHESFALEYRLRRHDGEYRWVIDAGRPRFGPGGELLGYVGSVIDITGNKEAEALLRELVERAPFGIYIVDSQFRIAHMNARSQIGAFRNVRPVIGRDCAEAMRILWPEPVAEQIIAVFRHTLETGDPYYSKDFVNPRGDIAAVEAYEWELHRIRLPDGQYGVISYFFDSTRLREAEQSLRQSEERYRSLTQAITSVVWTSDARGRFVTAQPAWSTYTGQTWDELRDVGWANALHPDDREKVLRLWEAACASKTPYQADGRLWHAASHSYRHFEARGVPILNPDGSVREWVGKCLDVEDRKRAEVKLRLLWESAAALLAADDPDAMLRGLLAKIGPHLGVDAYFNFMVDDSGVALRLASCEGIPAEAASKISRVEFGRAVCGTVALHRRPIVAAHIQGSDDPKVQLLKSFGIRAYACNPLLAENRLLGTLSFASRMKDQFDPSEVAFLDTICQYVTVAHERLRLLNELKEADRRKDEFLATLAHELRNPLAPVRNAVQVLRLKGSDAPETRWSREVIDRQVAHMTRLIDDLLDISRITRNKLDLRKERVEMAEVVSEAVETSRPLIEQCGLHLAVRLPPEPIYLDADLVRLSQVLTNLLTNAAKWTDPGGHIWLTVERQGPDVVVRIKDTGVGIPAENLPRLFEMFFQVDRALERSQGGLGIGLSLVRRLVELHGGSVQAHSAGRGKGSEFTVRLPALAEEPQAQPLQEATDSGATKAKTARRILVVDDLPDNADSLALLLRLGGNEVQTAYDGLAALEAAERFRPDVVLLDIRMPKLNGYDACRRIREQPWGKDMVLIALTGWGQEEDQRRTEEAGFDSHLVKPVDPAALNKLLADSVAG